MARGLHLLLLAVGTVLVTFTDNVSGLQCYNCVGRHWNDTCGLGTEEFKEKDEVALVTCDVKLEHSSHRMACRKDITVYLGHMGDSRLSTRDCISTNSSNRCKWYDGSGNTDTTFCICSDDGCNAAIATVPIAIATLLFGILAVQILH